MKRDVKHILVIDRGSIFCDIALKMNVIGTYLW